MRPDGVLETSIYVDDLGKAERFYRDVIGLEVHSRVEGRHVFFRCGDAMLLLFDPEATLGVPADVPAHGATGPGHVAFGVETGCLEAWRDHLAGSGVPIEADHTWPNGARSVYFRDPAGNSLEIAERRLWG